MQHQVKHADKIKTKRLRIGQIGTVVLATVGFAGLLTIAVLAPNAFTIFAPFLKNKKQPRRQEFQRNIDALVRQGIMKRTTQRDGTATLTLTKRGKWEFFLRHNSIDLGSKKKWDYKWRIIVFDVPNDKTSIRNEMRRAMKLYGFVMIQKSVWAYPYPYDDFVILLKKYLGVTNDVLYMVVEMIENDKELRSEFKLTD